MKYQKKQTSYKKNLHEIIRFCEDFLETKKFSDYCKNGLQITNSLYVKKIAFGVSASKNFLLQSAQWGADLCICHHGIIFGKIQEINDILKGRLKILIQNNMSLAGFHLPLDAHPTIGNNAVICKKLGLTDLEKVDVGFTGNLNQPKSFQKFLEKVESVMGQKANFFENCARKKVSRVCVISGGSSRKSLEALQSGADTFVFGEISEDAFHELKERELNFIVAGHYATEVFGVQALSEKIFEEFSRNRKDEKIEVKFFREQCTI